MSIPNTGSDFLPSRSQDPGSASKYLTTRIHNPDPDFLPIPDWGPKRHHITDPENWLKIQFFEPYPASWMEKIKTWDPV
jgi:hypothetical protein